MHLYTIQQSEVVPAPLERVFDFFSRPENLNDLTPPSLRLEFLTPRPIPMHVGATIDYIVRIRGLPMRWTTLITEYDPPHRFVDVQLRGPYAFWHHTHTFEREGDNTRISDDVRYGMPFGLFGRFIHRILVARDLNRVFSHRKERLVALFPSASRSS